MLKNIESESPFHVPSSALLHHISFVAVPVAVVTSDKKPKAETAGHATEFPR